MTQPDPIPPPKRSWLDLAYTAFNDPVLHKIIIYIVLALMAWIGKGKFDYIGQKAVENGAVIQDTHAAVIEQTSPDAEKVAAAKLAAVDAAKEVSPAAQMPLMSTPTK